MIFPDDLQYTEEHVWIESDGETAKIGITEFAVNQLGEVQYVGLADQGQELMAGETFTEIEFSEMIQEFSCPLSGEAIQVNDFLAESPELISENPYENWILELKLADPSELDDLLTAAEYEKSL
ncbi:MAG: glycine cleavage system protein GcvH [Parasporobacterium sp.]|nr:glycine cleavage system protein GcvH [Parasporobacterium sp.]